MRSKISVILAVLAYAGAAPARAETLEERVERLEQELRAVKQELLITQKADALPPEAAAKAAPQLTADASSGFTIRSADRAHQLKIRGVVQADGRFFVDNEPGASTFLLRRVRPIFDGTVAEHYDFRLVPDFGNGTTTLIDAYVDVNYRKAARLRAGKFKAPLSLERLQSDTDSPFTEVSLPASSLLPNRDTGVQLFGDLWEGGLSYAVAFANGATGGGSLDNDTEDDKEISARIFALPFKSTELDGLQGLGAGIAAGVGHQDGAVPVFRTFGQQTFFSYRSDVSADGRRLRVVPQAYYYWGPFGALGEYAFVAEDYKRAGQVTEVNHSAWSLRASYFLTGEENGFKTVKILRPFDASAGAWGAFEAKVRYDGLWVDKDTFANLATLTSSAQRADAFTAGLNWHLNQNVKWMLDYGHTTFNGGAAAGDREDESVILTRLQLVY